MPCGRSNNPGWPKGRWGGVLVLACYNILSNSKVLFFFDEGKHSVWQLNKNILMYYRKIYLYLHCK